MVLRNDIKTSTITSVTNRPLAADDLKFLIVPLFVIVSVMILSALVYLMSKKRRNNFIKHKLLSLYEFDSNEEEWESFSQENPSYTELLISNV